MRMPDVKAKKIKVLAKSLLEEFFNVQDFRLADEESNPPEKIFEVILKGRRNHLQVLWIPSLWTLDLDSRSSPPFPETHFFES